MKKFSILLLFISPLLLANELTLNQVTVTVNNEEFKSFDLPASQHTIDQNKLSNSGLQVNISDVLRTIPGVIASSRENYAKDLSISIRGFGTRSTFGVRGIKLFVDGIPATSSDGQGQAATAMLTSADHIDIIKGPLAQIYGNSSGGVINVYTKSPPKSPELLAGLFFGDYGSLKSNIQYGHQINNQLGLIVDYSDYQTNGFRDNSQSRREQFNTNINYTPDDKNKFKLVLNYIDEPYGYDPRGLSTLSEALSTPQKSTSPLSDRLRKISNQGQVGASFEHWFDNQNSLTTSLYLGNRKATLFNTPYISASSPGKYIDLNKDYYGGSINYGSKIKIDDRTINLNIGATYDYTEEIYQQGQQRYGEIIPNSLYRKNDRIATNNDVYAQLSTYLTEKTLLVAGARSSNVTMESTEQLTATFQGKVNFQAINPVIGVTQHINDSFNMFINYGKGFETPTLNEIGNTRNPSNPAENIAIFNKNLLASNSQHYEIGSKWLPNSLSRIDMTLFRITTANEIVTDLSSAGISSAKNAIGGTTRNGVELSAQLRPVDHIKYYGSYTYIGAKFNQTFNSSVDTIKQGNRLPGTPSNYFYSNLAFSKENFKLNKLRKLDGTTVEFESILSSKSYANDVNTVYAPGYDIHNLRFSHSWDLNQAYFFTCLVALNNVFNKAYIPSFQINNAAPFEPGPTRNYLVGVSAAIRY